MAVLTSMVNTAEVWIRMNVYDFSIMLYRHRLRACTVSVLCTLFILDGFQGRTPRRGVPASPSPSPNVVATLSCCRDACRDGRLQLELIINKVVVYI